MTTKTYLVALILIDICSPLSVLNGHKNIFAMDCLMLHNACNLAKIPKRHSPLSQINVITSVLPIDLSHSQVIQLL